jgi:putative heme-binding domain-containing protein
MKHTNSGLQLAFLLFLATLSSSHAEPLPHWVWNSDEESSPQQFSQSFSLHENTRAAILKVTGDFAELDIFLNDSRVASVEAFDPVLLIDLRKLGKPGENHLRIEAHPVPGPSAVAASLTLDTDAGSVTIGSENWVGNGVQSRGEILPARWGSNHLPEVPASAEYNQWKEALEDSSAKSVSPLPPGFRLTTVRSAKEEEDSWVSLAIDPKGRIIVAKEQKGLLRFTLTNEGEEVALVETINEDLEECRGIAFRGDVLYLNANDSKALYRLRDTNGDDQFDEVTEIQATTGSVGHGRNDLAVGPEGAIHAIHGDSVDSPERTEFFTAPEDPDAKPLGHWLTIGPGDNQWTLLARGLRNPYGIDFNPDGEAFTYDADNEGDVGLPFYRPSRINHLVTGANYGWHQRPGNTRSIPVYAPDSVPTTFDVGRGSPTGVKFGTRSNFGVPWNETLFALDWAYGRIIAVHPTPRGGSYYASGEVFLEGRPLNVTDLEFDRDGAMYFTTGGRKTRSALFRLSRDSDGERETSLPRGTQAQERERFSAEQRKLRERMERNKEPVTADSECWNYLGSADPWIRNAARVRLERRPVDEWRHLIEGTEEGLPRLTALLALVRQGNADDQLFSVRNAAILETKGWRQTEKLTFLRICELGWSDAIPGPTDQDISRHALAWLETPDRPVTREVIRVLSIMNHPAAVEQGLLLLTDSQTQSDRLFYMEMLSRVSSGWKDDSRVSYFKSLANARDTSRGDRFMPPFFEALEKDALDSAPEAIRGELAALLQPVAPPEEAPVTPRAFVQNWTMGDFSSSDFDGSASVSRETGLELFRAGLCHQCHTFGATGLPVGPDLSTVGSRFTPEDLLRSILEPSAVVSEVYRNVTAELADGSSVTGRLMRDDFRKSTLFLSTNPFAPTVLTEVPKADILKLTESEISPMPPGLLSGLKKDEVIQLLHWLRRGTAP